MSDFSKIAISLLLSLGRKHLLKKSSDSSIQIWVYTYFIESHPQSLKSNWKLKKKLIAM